MPNNDYILRGDAVALIVGGNKLISKAWLMNALATTPAADVEPKRKPGRWVSKEGIYGVVYCSICDFELKIDNTPHCPNCGAKMDKEVKNVT